MKDEEDDITCSIRLNALPEQSRMAPSLMHGVAGYKTMQLIQKQAYEYC
jgi:hypothetical protein